MLYDITMNELAQMTKIIKKVMKFNKRFYKKEESGKEKRPSEQTFEKSSNDKGKGFSKGKKLNVITVEVWDIMLMIILVLKMSKSLCRQHGVT